MTFLKVNTIGAGAPVIQYAVKVKESLEYEIFWFGRKISPGDLIGKSLLLSRMSSFSFCKLLLGRLDGKKDASSLEQKDRQNN